MENCKVKNKKDTLDRMTLQKYIWLYSFLNTVNEIDDHNMWHELKIYR